MEAKQKEAEAAAAAAAEQTAAEEAAAQKPAAPVDDAAAAAAEEQALLEKAAREMEMEEAAEAAREAEARAAAEKEKAEKAAAERERAEKAAAEKAKAAAERAKAAEAKKAEAAKRAEAAAAAQAARAPKSPPRPKSPQHNAGVARPQLKKGAGKSGRANETAPPGDPAGESLDTDLQAKLAARRARAEAGGAEPDVAAKAASGGQGFDDVRVSADLKVKLAARKERAEMLPKERAEMLPARAEVGAVSDGLGLDDGRTELVSFLAGAGELDAGTLTPLAAARGACGLGESGVITPDIDIASLMIGHGAGLLGHGGGWGDGDASAAEPFGATTYLAPYDPAGTGAEADPLLEEILKASLNPGAEVGMRQGGDGGELERVLATVLDAGETPSFDPVNEVPVNWGDVAAATAGAGDEWDTELAAAAARARAMHMEEGGALFDMKIGTLQVEGDGQSRVRVGDAGRVSVGYLSEQALAPLTAAGGGGVSKVVDWDEGAMEGLGAGGAGYPATGAQRRAMIAERQRQLDRQRQLAMELAAMQREQAQAQFAEYKGPPCGVGMALQASTRMLMGTLRNHKRWVIEVDSLLPEGPAAKCGQILPGDVLLSVREASDKVATSVSNRVEEAKALIMGPPGSAVTLRFTRGETMREHTHASFEVSLVRESIKHPPPPPDDAHVVLDDEVDWALLPEQATVEPGDTPLSLEGVSLANLSNEQLQAFLTGEEGRTAEMIVRKKDGSQARVTVKKKPAARPVQELKQLLQGAGGCDRSLSTAAEQRFLGSRTLAKIASALPAAPSGATLGAAMRPVSDKDTAAAGVGGGGSWLSKVGGKVGGLWGRVTAANSEPNAAAASPEKPAAGSPTRATGTAAGGPEDAVPRPGDVANEGAEGWVVLTSPSKSGAGGFGVAGEGETREWQAGEGGQQVCKLLEEKRLPADMGPRLHVELGVQSLDDFAFIEADDLERLRYARRARHHPQKSTISPIKSLISSALQH